MILYSRSYLLFIAILAALSFKSYSQSLSPNSASAANLSAAQTGPYTGKPNISVPVTSISGRDISIPVSLSYNASGVRVEEVGSWVGLGWNLNVGGVITQEVRGRDDWGTKGYFSSSVPVAPDDVILSDCSVDGTGYETYMQEVMSGAQDAEPDLFNISLPGFSAQFFIDSNGIPHTIPRQKISIEKPTSSIGEWTVKTLDGYEYTFGGTGYYETGVGKAWYLKEIVSPRGETASFYYARHSVFYSLPKTEFRLFVLNGTCGASDEDYEYFRSINVQSLFLERVEIGNSVLEFSLSDRCDIRGKKLERITVKEEGDQIGAFSFDYSCDEITQRLWLMEFRSEGRNDEPLPPHRFDYLDKESLPGITSKAQDHWGYYNGQDGNTMLTPSYLQSGFVFSGANRNPSSTNVLKGTLKRITYPMGGYTDYTFEVNEYSNYTDRYPELGTTNVSYRAVEGYQAGPSDPNSRQFTLNETTTVNFDVNVKKIGGLAPSGPGEDPVAGDDDPVEGHNVKLKKGTNVIQTWIEGDESPETLSLGSGTYTIEASIDGNDSEAFTANIIASYQTLTPEPSSPASRYGGGIRINKIVTSDGINHSEDIVQTFNYKTFDTAVSSGKLMSGPVYHYETRFFCDDTDYTDYLVLSSSSTIPLSSAAAGSYVGYSNVTVRYKDGDGEGRTRYSFKNEAETFVLAQGSFNAGDPVPYAPTEGDWYKNGLLNYQEDYRFFDNQFVLQSRNTNSYVFADPIVADALVIADQEYGENECQDMFYGYYSVNTAWIQQTSSLSETYDGDGATLGNLISTSSENQYDSGEPWLVASSKAFGSDGTEYLTEYKYPKDFSGSVFGGAITGMQNDYLLAIPVQTISKKKIGGTYYVTGSSLTSFQSVAGTYLPDKAYSLEIEAPVSDFSFNASNPLSDSRMEEQASFSYDAMGNLVQSERENKRSSNIFGYEDQMVMASASNALASEIAYSGFETDEQGNWSYTAGNVVQNDAYAGHGSFSNGTLTSNTLPSNSYRVELWAKGAGNVTIDGTAKAVTAQWVHYTWQATGTSFTVTVPAGVIVDEVRLYPVGSMMTSYTYEPAIGVTSVAGNNGKTLFTEYDHFNRPVIQRDFKKQILSQKEFNLRAQLFGSIRVPETVDIYSAANFSIDLGEDLPPGITCTWDFDDGSSAKVGTSVSHTYTQMGYKEVTVTLTKADYAPIVERKSIFVGGELAGEIAHDVATFDEVFNLWIDGFENNPPGTECTWSIGGKTGSAIQHRYISLGSKLVQVTMSHPDFPDRTLGTYIPVQPLGTLEGTFNLPTVTYGSAFTLTATGIGNNPAGTTYEWTYNGIDEGSGTSMQRDADRLGTYIASLKMSKVGYYAVTINRSIFVNGNLNASWSGPSALDEDVVGNFSATGTSINPTGATYVWTYDGNSLGSGNSISKAFTTPTAEDQNPAKKVKLSVNHPDYSLKSVEKDLTINFGDPILTASTPVVQHPTITLTTDNGNGPFDYSIEVISGSGSPYTLDNTSQRSVQFNTDYSGLMTIKMKVVDEDNNSDEIVRTISAGPLED